MCSHPFSSPTRASIFSLYSAVFISTVALPLTAGRMVILSVGFLEFLDMSTAILHSVV